MKKFMNIDSSDWCDVIFEKRNKAYGAYALRQSSTKRHLVAFGTVVLLAIAIAVFPMLLSTIKAATSKPGQGVDEAYTVMNIENDYKPDVEEIIQPKMEQPKLEVMLTSKFTPPRIVDEIDPDKSEMKGHNEIFEAEGIISKFEVPEGSKSKFAIDPNELELHRKIMDDSPAKVHEIVEAMPAFPGGESEMNRYLRQNLKYPVSDQEQNIQGRVTLRFVVDKEGNISNVTVLKGISPNCDREAVRVVKSMPRWIPGRQNGNAVAVYFNLPIVFRLQ